jgi:hypothetical protein
MAWDGPAWPTLGVLGRLFHLKGIILSLVAVILSSRTRHLRVIGADDRWRAGHSRTNGRRGSSQA